MHIIYLAYPDRAATLAALEAALGYASTAETSGGREAYPQGFWNSTRFDLDFLRDKGVALDAPDDLVNLYWHGDPAAAPDFGAAVVEPATPSIEVVA